MFFCEFSEISHKIFFKNPSGRLLLHKHSFCLLSQHDLVPVQKRCYTYFPVEYFLGIFCTLGTRVSSIFQILTEKPIFNLLEHLWWSVFAKIDSSLKRLSIFTKEFSWRRMVKTNILVLTKTPWRFLLKTKTKDVFKTSSKRLIILFYRFIFCCIATKRSSFKPKSSSKSKIESQNETLVGCKFQNVKETNLQKF